MLDDKLTTDCDGVLDDATPANDVADQLRLARPEPTDDEQAREQSLKVSGSAGSRSSRRS